MLSCQHKYRALIVVLIVVVTIFPQATFWVDQAQTEVEHDKVCHLDSSSMIYSQGTICSSFLRLSSTRGFHTWARNLSSCTHQQSRANPSLPMLIGAQHHQQHKHERKTNLTSPQQPTNSCPTRIPSRFKTHRCTRIPSSASPTPLV